jgi:hypothetical protein
MSLTARDEFINSVRREHFQVVLNTYVEGFVGRGKRGTRSN